jgi:hypothetical protein
MKPPQAFLKQTVKDGAPFGRQTLARPRLSVVEALPVRKPETLSLSIELNLEFIVTGSEVCNSSNAQYVMRSGWKERL